MRARCDNNVRLFQLPNLSILILTRVAGYGTVSTVARQDHHENDDGALG